MFFPSFLLFIPLCLLILLYFPTVISSCLFICPLLSLSFHSHLVYPSLYVYSSPFPSQLFISIHFSLFPIPFPFILLSSSVSYSIYIYPFPSIPLQFLIPFLSILSYPFLFCFLFHLLLLLPIHSSFVFLSIPFYLFQFIPLFSLFPLFYIDSYPLLLVCHSIPFYPFHPFLLFLLCFLFCFFHIHSSCFLSCIIFCSFPSMPLLFLIPFLSLHSHPFLLFILSFLSYSFTSIPLVV